jgi:hypothetical protein
MESINLSRLIRTSRLDDESREGWLRWALIALISQDGAESSSRFFDSAKEGEEKPDAICNIELKINGIDVGFEPLIHRLVESFNRNVDSTARLFVKDGIKKIIDRLQDKVIDFEEHLNKITQDFENHLVSEGVSLGSVAEKHKDQIIFAALLNAVHGVDVPLKAFNDQEKAIAKLLYDEYDRRIRLYNEQEK